jgi:2-iminoacetate synthase
MIRRKAMYDVKSKKAEEFINHEEILDTLEYAKANKNNRPLLDDILKKAADMKGISHREAAVLLECEQEDVIHKMYQLAKEIKQKFYGNRIVMFAPLYLSNYCVNGCVYCPYHYINKHIPRKKLSQEDIKREVIALQDMGHKRLALEAGEDPINNPIEYILESIQTIYSIQHKNGAIRRVNVNIAATTIEDYKKLKEAGIGTYILFQETYHKENYEKLHPTGPKHNYAYHTEAMDRAMEGGIDDVGLGVLFGLNMYRYDFAGILMHAEHLEAAQGVGPHTISVPRIRPAEDIDPSNFQDAISDEIFEKIVAILRIAVPYTGLIVSTRESQKSREKVLGLGVSQISGGSKTSVGGYAVPEPEEEKSSQFDVEDTRTLDEIVNWLLTMGFIPSFCTACYREGRTGDRFMTLVKSGQIANCCQPNALMTLKEYLEDYAAPDTKTKGEALIEKELMHITNDKVRQIATENIRQMMEGKRDFRF